MRQEYQVGEQNKSILRPQSGMQAPISPEIDFQECTDAMKALR